MKKNIRIILILFSVIFLVVAGGLFLPEIFLKYSAEKLSGQIQTVPSQYYLSACCSYRGRRVLNFLQIYTA